MRLANIFWRAQCAAQCCCKRASSRTCQTMTSAVLYRCQFCRCYSSHCMASIEGCLAMSDAMQAPCDGQCMLLTYTSNMLAHSRCRKVCNQCHDILRDRPERVQLGGMLPDTVTWLPCKARSALHSNPCHRRCRNTMNNNVTKRRHQARIVQSHHRHCVDVACAWLQSKRSAVLHICKCTESSTPSKGVRLMSAHLNIVESCTLVEARKQSSICAVVPKVAGQACKACTFETWLCWADSRVPCTRRMKGAATERTLIAACDDRCTPT